MNTSAIAKLINVFNVTAVSIAACFAAAGALAVILKISRSNALWFSRVNVIVKAFCAAALAAFALEATAFNFPHYLKYFAGPPTGIIGQSETDQNALLTTDGADAELINHGVRFKNLDRSVTSVFANIEFGDLDTVDITVIWADEGVSQQQFVKRLYKYLPHENYAPMSPCGKVSELAIVFGPGAEIVVSDVELNKPIPFYFSGLRLLVVWLILFALIALINKRLREKAAYYLFEYRFDPKNKRQNIVYACAVALLILFSWVCVYTSFTHDQESDLRLCQYNKFLVDALIDGRPYLNYGNPETLLNAERPYDAGYRRANGFVYAGDWAWYNGKYYCYFGVVPAVLLFVPYKLFTGGYLSNHAGVFLSCAISVILLAALWRRCVKKYMRDTLYAFYLLSFLTLFFASCLIVNLRFPYFYSIAQSFGFMFNIAGFLLLLKSVDGKKIHYLTLFFACLCLALVFGCRPNMGLASLFVPIVLWKHRTWKSIAFAALPYLIVAVPLCLYNYIRFDSIFEFGANYNLTAPYVKAFGYQNVLGKIYRVFISSAHYLFRMNQLSLNFPYVKTVIGGPETFWWTNQISLGVLWAHFGGIGMINFPIVFLLFYLFKNISGKNKPNAFYVMSASLVVAAAIIIANSLVLGITGRYTLDIAVFIVLPSLFCAYYWSHEGIGQTGFGQTYLLAPLGRLSLTYALLLVSIFVGLFLCISVENYHSDPTLYRYLEYSLGIFRSA